MAICCGNLNSGCYCEIISKLFLILLKNISYLTRRSHYELIFMYACAYVIYVHVVVFILFCFETVYLLMWFLHHYSTFGRYLLCVLRVYIWSLGKMAWSESLIYSIQYMALRMPNLRTFFFICFTIRVLCYPFWAWIPEI